MKTLEFANGDQMPAFGLGTWKSAPGDVYNAVKTALAAGYRHIDCASVYNNEAEVGTAVHDAVKEGIVTRQALWITSKLWCDCFAPEDVQPACQKTLDDLQLNYLDLYLMHWPVPIKKGHSIRTVEDFIPPAELPLSTTWQAMEALVDQGLSRHIGVSNFSAGKLRNLVATARIKPEMNQIEMHPYLQQPALVKFCSQQQIHITGYSPLGSADRPASLKSRDEAPLLEDPVINEIALKHKASPAQVALRWAIDYGIATIPKSVNPQRIRENLAAIQLLLDDDDRLKLQQLDRHSRYLNGDFWIVDNGYYTLNTLWNE